MRRMPGHPAVQQPAPLRHVRIRHAEHGTRPSPGCSAAGAIAAGSCGRRAARRRQSPGCSAAGSIAARPRSRRCSNRGTGHPAVQQPAPLRHLLLNLVILRVGDVTRLFSSRLHCGDLAKAERWDDRDVTRLFSSRLHCGSRVGPGAMDALRSPGCSAAGSIAAGSRTRRDGGRHRSPGCSAAGSIAAFPGAPSLLGGTLVTRLFSSRLHCGGERISEDPDIGQSPGCSAAGAIAASRSPLSAEALTRVTRLFSSRRHCGRGGRARRPGGARGHPAVQQPAPLRPAPCRVAGRAAARSPWAAPRFSDRDS